MCPALASPELLWLALVWGKRCKSVPGGLVGWRVVRKLLPLESDPLLCPLRSLSRESSSLLSSNWELSASLASLRVVQWLLTRSLIFLGGVSLSESITRGAVVWLRLAVLVRGIRYWAGCVAGSRALLEDVRSRLLRVTIWLGAGLLLRGGCFGTDAGGSSGLDGCHSLGRSQVGNGSWLCIWADL